MPQDDKNGGKKTSKEEHKGIVVTQEVGVRTEQMPENVDPAANDWGYDSVKRDNRFSS